MKTQRISIGNGIIYMYILTTEYTNDVVIDNTIYLVFPGMVWPTYYKIHDRPNKMI